MPKHGTQVSYATDIYILWGRNVQESRSTCLLQTVLAECYFTALYSESLLPNEENWRPKRASSAEPHLRSLGQGLKRCDRLEPWRKKFLLWHQAPSSNLEAITGITRGLRAMDLTHQKCGKRRPHRRGCLSATLALRGTPHRRLQFCADQQKPLGMCKLTT